MVRIKPTWRSWMRYLSLSAWGGTLGTLLLLGIGTTLAQPQTFVIPRRPRPIPTAIPSPDAAVQVPTQTAPDTPPAPYPQVVNVAPMTPPWAAPPVPQQVLPPLPKPANLPPASAPAAPPSATPGNLNLLPPSAFNPAAAKPTPGLPPKPADPVVNSPIMQVSNPPPVVMPPAPTPVLKPEIKPTPIEVRHLPPAPLSPVPLPAAPPVKLLSPPTPPPASLSPVPPVSSMQPAGTTPFTTPDVQREYGQYVKSIIDPQTTLDLVVGRSRLMVLASAPQRVQVGDEHIAVSEEVSPTELSLKAKTVGTTVLNLWFADSLDTSKHKILSYLVRVYPDPQAKERLRDDYRVLADEINCAFPESQVSLTTVGDKLTVSGQAKDVGEAAQILRIVRSHAAGETSAASDPMPAEGTPDNPLPVAQQLVQVAGPNVVNLLRVPGEQQVMLRVTVAEVDRAAARSIGLNCSVERHDGTTIFSTRTGELAGLTSMDGTNVPVFLDNGQIGLAIHALRNMNMAKSIAEPHLAALNGHCAEFSTGGKFPVPCANGTDFVPYGVRLNFTPLITDRDCIRLTVQAEVSTKDIASTVPVGCTPVPGLNSRSFKTTVELREGQTMAVAGLIQNNCGSASHGSPWLCELPGVGRLFGSEITATSEQELIVLITPELVHPLECKDAPPLPGCDLIQPTDLEFYLMGHVQGQGAVRVDPAQLKRVSHCEDVFIAGPQGFSNGHPDPRTKEPQ